MAHEYVPLPECLLWLQAESLEHREDSRGQAVSPGEPDSSFVQGRTARALPEWKMTFPFHRLHQIHPEHM